MSEKFTPEQLDILADCYGFLLQQRAKRLAALRAQQRAESEAGQKAKKDLPPPPDEEEPGE